MNQEQKDEMYDLWGRMDLVVEDKLFAIDVGKRLFPDYTRDQINDAFYDFLDDCPAD